MKYAIKIHLFQFLTPIFTHLFQKLTMMRDVGRADNFCGFMIIAYICKKFLTCQT